jgi:type IV secretory pathway TrbD component
MRLVSWLSNNVAFEFWVFRERALARKAVRRNRKRKNMAVKLFGADRDVVLMLAGAGALAILIIVFQML